MSPAETFNLCVKGVKHRFLRSVLTLAVVVLAVAFFMFLISESMFLRSTWRGVRDETHAARTAQTLLTKFFTPATELATVNRLSEAWRNGDNVLLDEFAAVTGSTRPEVDALAVFARKEAVYTQWFSQIPTGKRTILTRKTRGREALDFIVSDLERFKDDLEPMIDLRIPGKREGISPGKREGLYAFLDEYPAYKNELRVFNGKWNEKVLLATALADDVRAAVAETRAGGGRQDDSDLFATVTDEEAETLRAGIVALGFAFDAAALAAVRDQSLVAKETSEVYKALNTQAVKEAWLKAFKETKITSPEHRIQRLSDPRAMTVFEGMFTSEQLERVEKNEKSALRLVKLDRKLSAVISEDGGFLGLSERQIFLLAISFVVCMVGIANAMLMSITERFREIATMKCLGATDSYILTQFMMEAAMQGFFGGILGVLIGFAIATLRGSIAYSAHLWAYWPWADIGFSAVASLIAGILLAILASIQPSWSASRMAPMEAMRVE